MKISFLHKFLTSFVSIGQFKSQINKEVEIYKLQLQKKGASIALFIEEDFEFVFTKDYILKLCDYYLSDELNCSELEYVVDCITITENITYKNEELFDFLELMTDSKVNGEITKEKILNIKKSISG
jgi:hypothetical protein